jgi:uncharacterized protein YuzB (UPF0349 family)
MGEPFGTDDPFEQLRSSGERSGVEFQCLDFCPICRTADVMRATMPEELHDHLHNLQREGLLAMRALLDHYIQHLERQRARSVPIEDIPIE